MRAKNFELLFPLLGEPRYEANCTLAAAYGSVATPWNRITIPRRGALPYTAASAHFSSSNCGLQDD